MNSQIKWFGKFLLCLGMVLSAKLGEKSWIACFAGALFTLLLIGFPPKITTKEKQND